MLSSLSQGVILIIIALTSGGFALLGSWLSSRSSYRQQHARFDHEKLMRQQELRLAHLEELYSLAEKWANLVVCDGLLYQKAMDGELSYNQVLDIIINRSNSNFDACRMITLAQLYFPESHQALTRVLQARDDAAKIQKSFKERYKQDGRPSKKHSNQLTNVLGEFDDALEHYKKELAKYAMQI
ncbi:MAG TPA: hypothetical protein ENH34_04710 [Phycisphaerales bacterium]|nr:hypothetical protein [Phycisphaerales bacterium]